MNIFSFLNKNRPKYGFIDEKSEKSGFYINKISGIWFKRSPSEKPTFYIRKFLEFGLNGLNSNNRFTDLQSE
jgi:hypothetical protein